MLDFAKIQWTFANAIPEEGALERFFAKFIMAYGYQFDKSKSFGGIVLYDQKLATATNLDFFTGVPVTGNTNLNSFTRPQGEHFVITSIRAFNGNSATINTSAWSPGITDPAHLNGTFDFVNNGVKELNKIPLTTFTNAVENPFSGFYELPFLKIWGGQENISINNTFFSAGVANENIRYELHGLGLLS